MKQKRYRTSKLISYDLWAIPMVFVGIIVYPMWGSVPSYLILGLTGLLVLTTHVLRKRRRKQEQRFNPGSKYKERFKE